MSNTESTKLLEAITRGIEEAVRRLVIQTQHENGELVISSQGKIHRVKGQNLTPGTPATK